MTHLSERFRENNLDSAQGLEGGYSNRRHCRPLPRNQLYAIHTLHSQLHLFLLLSPSSRHLHQDTGRAVRPVHNHLVPQMLRARATGRDLLKRLHISRPVLNLLIGTLAGAVNVCFVQPLWVANARMKLQGTAAAADKTQCSSTLETLLHIYREEVPAATNALDARARRARPRRARLCGSWAPVRPRRREPVQPLDGCACGSMRAWAGASVGGCGRAGGEQAVGGGVVEPDPLLQPSHSGTPNPSTPRNPGKILYPAPSLPHRPPPPSRSLGSGLAYQCPPPLLSPPHSPPAGKEPLSSPPPLPSRSLGLPARHPPPARSVGTASCQPVPSLAARCDRRP